MVAKGVGIRGGKEWEFGISRGKLLYIRWISSKALLYSTGDNIKYPMTKHNGKEHKIYMCIYYRYTYTYI